MLFDVWAQVGSSNHVLYRGPDPRRKMGNFMAGKDRPIVKVKYREHELLAVERFGRDGIWHVDT